MPSTYILTGIFVGGFLFGLISIFLGEIRAVRAAAADASFLGRRCSRGARRVDARGVVISVITEATSGGRVPSEGTAVTAAAGAAIATAADASSRSVGSAVALKMYRYSYIRFVFYKILSQSIS